MSTAAIVSPGSRQGRGGTPVSERLPAAGLVAHAGPGCRRRRAVRAVTRAQRRDMPSRERRACARAGGGAWRAPASCAWRESPGNAVLTCRQSSSRGHAKLDLSAPAEAGQARPVRAPSRWKEQRPRSAHAQLGPAAASPLGLRTRTLGQERHASRVVHSHRRACPSL